MIYLAFDDLPSELKDEVFAIGTNFNINERQQRALFAAAREVVSRHKAGIVKAVFGRTCGGGS